ncbi:MAG: hypothetical protein CMH52_08605 [Myxococcales bacterium]|nr:hypothetical protein [Myxococcales bacterium]
MSPHKVLVWALMAQVSLAHAADGGLPGLGSTPADAQVQAEVKKVAKGPPPAVKMECLPNPVLIGQPVVCELIIIHREDVTLTVTSPADITPLSAPPAQAHGEGLLKSVRRLQVIPKSMKKVHIQELVIVWTEADGGIGEYPVSELRIPVQSMMTGVTDPKPRTYDVPVLDSEAADLQSEKKRFFNAHGPIPYRVTNWPLLITLLVLVGGAVFTLLGIWLNRWLKARQTEPAPWVDPRPAHIIAYEALDLLRSERLPDKDLFEDYYVRISEIIRAYLKKRYGINGLEMTSEEIRTWAARTRLGPDPERALTDFLYETDIVKFANVKPNMVEIEIITKQAHGLIELTRRSETEQGGAADEGTREQAALNGGTTQ